MKQKKLFKPENLRTILAVMFALLVVGGTGAVYYYFGVVRDYSVEVNQLQAQADAVTDKSGSSSPVLANADQLIAKADSLFSTPKKYKSQATNDIKKYATAAGLSVKSISFSSDEPYTAVVKLGSPASYTEFLTFLNNIETSLPKLHVSSLSLTSDDVSDPDSIGLGTIKIGILVR